MPSCGKKANLKSEKSVSSSTEEDYAWSEWMENIPDSIKNDSKNYVVESKTEAKTETLYSYRDKETITTTTPKNTNEWTLSTEPVINWSNWSMWQRDEIKGNSTRIVEKRNVPQKLQTQYVYYQYKSEKDPSKGFPVSQSIEPNGHLSYPAQIWVNDPLEEKGTFMGVTTYGPSVEDAEHPMFKDKAERDMWYIATPSTRQTVFDAHDEWRYKDFVSASYSYYKFTNWSPWSSIETYATSTKEVKTKENTVNIKMYRYRKI